MASTLSLASKASNEATSSTETIVSTTSNAPSLAEPSVSSPSPRKGSAFWLSYAAVCICTFVSALDIARHYILLTSIPTALPSIIKNLPGTAASSWVGGSYTLASAALVPLTGNLANIFGRRPIMLGSIILFAVGSALAGSAQSMQWLIIARSWSGSLQPFAELRARHFFFFLL
ncbi:hypothetical protein B0H11DRAFT_1720360 [Mycena galericulata]|nr:hypothetical protein B0H11DRAFT_1720360 [Mycena galericulata]